MSSVTIQATEWKVFEDLLDSQGRPRLNCARNYFSRINQEDIPVLSEAFKYWRDYAEYLLLKGENRINGKEMFVAVKCSKRGNDVFSNRLDRKVGILGELEGINLFSLKDFDNKPYMPSNLLWVTLTFNPNLCSLNDAWDSISYCWNLWITNMRNKYGKIKALKFIEAFPDPNGKAFGYPHIHAVLLFEEKTFNAFPTVETGKDGKTGVVYRIKERDEIKSQGKWSAFSDIKAIYSGKALGGYLRKHCKNTHGGDDPSALTTQSILWLKKKQTFSMSSGFSRDLHDLISGLHNSKTCWAQETLEGEVLDDWVWSAHGVRSGFDVGADCNFWAVSLSAEKFHSLVDFGRGF